MLSTALAQLAQLSLLLLVHRMLMPSPFSSFSACRFTAPLQIGLSTHETCLALCGESKGNLAQATKRARACWCIRCEAMVWVVQTSMECYGKTLRGRLPARRQR